MIELPLTPLNRIRIARAFASVPRVDISIDSIVENQMGKAFVDNIEMPSVFLVEQGGFFAFLTGNVDSEAGRNFIQHVPKSRLLMAASDGWFEALKQLHADKLKPLLRYKFSDKQLSKKHLAQLLEKSLVRDSIRQVDLKIAQETSGPVLSIGDFESAEDFVQRGIGFVSIQDGKVIGGAYSSLVSNRAIEISIYVDENYRQKGIATALSAALLSWCLDHHLEAHWDAANRESCGLATKLGYIADGEYTAYFLTG